MCGWGWGGAELFTCPYPLKVQARLPRDQTLATQDSTHINLYTSRVAQAGMIKRSMGPLVKIDPTSFRTLSGRSTTKLHLAPDRKDSLSLTSDKSCLPRAKALLAHTARG